MRSKFFIFWCSCTAFLILLFTSRSSFLFPTNNWDDVNSYFTMGKGMMNGLVIYRDLYDQKGPFLYLLFGIAYLISHKTFFGVFIFEVIAAALTLFFAGRLISRRSNETMAYFAIPVLAAGMYSSWSFYWGGAAEEFCLPMFAYSIYALDGILHDYYEEKDIAKIISIVGVFAGITAEVKYTMLGFYAAWFFIALIYLFKNRGFKEILLLGIRFILYAAIPTLIWFVYFIFTGSLDDWYRCYIYNNLFFYTDVTGIDSSFIKKSYEITKNLYWLIFDSFSYFVFIIAGFIIQLFGEKGIIRKVSSLIMFAMTYFVIFIGGNKLAYYSIPLMTFAIPGVAYLAGLIHSFTKNINVNKGIFLLGCMVVLGAGTAFSGFNCQSSEFRKQDKESLWLYRMASQMDIDQKTTLLNINALDVGLYTITGIVPNCEYFQTNGIGLPTMFEEQHRYIKEGVTDYVIASYSTPDNIDEHYELLTSETYYTNGEPREYYLYKKVR